MALPGNVINPGQAVPFIAGGTISQYDVVCTTVEGFAVVAGGSAGHLTIGVAAHDATINQIVSVWIAGIVWVTSDAAVSIQAVLAPDPTTAGRVETAGAADVPCGLALAASAAAGERLPMLIMLSTQAI